MALSCVRFTVHRLAIVLALVAGCAGASQPPSATPPKPVKVAAPARPAPPPIASAAPAPERELAEQVLSCWGGGPSSVHGVEVAGVTDAVELALGGSDSCARTAAGAVWCWGRHHALAGPYGIAATAKQVDGIDDAIALATAGEVGCALRQAGPLVCWGSQGRP